MIKRLLLLPLLLCSTLLAERNPLDNAEAQTNVDMATFGLDNVGSASVDVDSNGATLTAGGVDVLLASDDVITPDMVLSTGQSDEYCLTYEATGDTWEWAACAAGGTDDQDLTVTAGGADDSVIDIEDGTDVTISGSTYIDVTEAASTITIAGDISAMEGAITLSNLQGSVTDGQVPDDLTIAAGASVSIEAAEISDLNGGTDITADLEEETHATEHENGGADEISVAGLSGQLADGQLSAVSKNSGATVGTRSVINLIEGTNITLTVTDDAGGDEVDVTIDAGGGGTDDQDLTVTAGGSNDSVIDIEDGTDVTISGTTEILVTEAASTITVGHADLDGGQADVDNSGTTVVQDIGFDGLGHVDSVVSADLGAHTTDTFVTNKDSHDHAGGDGAQIDHGGLGGLTDDDHSQYVLVDGSRDPDFTGAVSIESATPDLILDDSDASQSPGRIRVNLDTLNIAFDIDENGSFETTVLDLTDAGNVDFLGTITAGSGDVAITQADGDLVASALALNDLTEDSAITSGDFIPYWDTTEGAVNKVDLDDLPGGSETNDLESVATSAGDAEVFVGTGADAGAYITGLAACAADEKIEYVPGSPDTFTCEAIGSLVEADISDLSHTTDTNLTQEEVEDFAGALIKDGTGTHTGIAVTYQDATGDVDFVVDHDAASNFDSDEHFTQAAISITESQISDLSHTTDTNADTACSGTTTYLDGEGNCDDISGVYEPAGITESDISDLVHTSPAGSDTEIQYNNSGSFGATENFYWTGTNVVLTSPSDSANNAFYLARARVGPAAVQADDVLADISFLGYDTAYSGSALIRAVAAANHGSGGDVTDSPGKLLFYTVADGSSSLVEALTINSDQTITFDQYDCTGNANGGVLTADANGNISCADDDSAAGGGDEVLIDGTGVSDASGVDLIGGSNGIDIAFNAGASPDTATFNFDVAEAEADIETAIDTLANLTSVQSLAITLADAGADAVLGWDDTASAYENLTAGEVLAIVGGTANDFDGSGDVTIVEADISDLSHTTDTGPSPDCSGTTTYQDGEGNCDDISSVYEPAGITEADISDLVHTVPELYIDAGAMLPKDTSGAEAYSEEYATNDINLDYYLFAGDAVEGVQFKFALPVGWDASITYVAYWDAANGASAADGVTWGLACNSISNDDAIDAALGTRVDVDDTVIAVGDLHVSAESGAVTIGGSPAAGHLVFCEPTRQVGDANDDMVEEAKLLGILINK